MHSSIYAPEEDSYLMSEILKKKIPVFLKENSDLRFLEIGAGSGINLETAFNSGIKKENIFSCDINKEAVKHCVSLGFDCIYSDLFSKINGKSDIIIFNPPYLPEDKAEPKDFRISTTGGKKGSEVIIKFLKSAKKYLNKKGGIFLLTSSLTPKINFKNLGYNSKILKTKKLFFEELSVWELELI